MEGRLLAARTSADAAKLLVSAENSAPPAPRAPVSVATGTAPSPAPVRVQAPAVTTEEEPPPIFDESAEAAFLGEARDRGEPVIASPAASKAVEDAADNKNLPPLSELVQRIPPEVRETLEELFRAKFVTVRRVPAKALKPTG